MKASRSVFPLAAMAAVVCLDAVGAVAVSEWLGGIAPLAFGAVLTSGVAVAAGLYLAAAQRGLLTWTALRAIVGLHRGDTEAAAVLRRDLLLGSLARLDWPLFAVAVSAAPPAIASIVFLGLWPIMFVLLMHRLVSSSSMSTGHRRANSAEYAVMAVGAVGLALVVASRAGSESAARSGWDAAIGVGLALLAVSLGSFGAFHYSWGHRTAAMLDHETAVNGVRGGSSDERLAANLTMLAFLAANIAALPLLAGLAVWVVSSSSSKVGGSHLLAAFVIGAVIVAPEGILTRLANLCTANLTVNAVSYFSPVAAVGLFAVTGRALGVDGGMLTVGTSGIVAVNLMLNFDPDQPLTTDRPVSTEASMSARWGFRTLAIAVWAAGAVVYFREDLLRQIGVESAAWGNGDFWGAVALSATVFILILSFRQSRLAERTQHERELALAVCRGVERLHRSGALADPNTMHWALAATGRHRSPSAWPAYVSLEESLAAARLDAGTEAEAHRIAAVSDALDMFASSRQSGREFPEMAALALFGLTSAGLVLFARPLLDGWPAMLADVFSVVFASGTAFLYAALFDSMNSRDSAAMTLSPGQRFAVAEADGRRAGERAVALTIGAALFGIYCVLLWHKWAPAG